MKERVAQMERAIARMESSADNDIYISAGMMSPFCNIVMMSRLNAENVVNPPSTPVVRNINSAEGGLAWERNPTAKPIISEPMTFTASVPSGNIAAKAGITLYIACIARKRIAEPIAPPSATRRHFVRMLMRAATLLLFLLDRRFDLLF